MTAPSFEGRLMVNVGDLRAAAAKAEELGLDTVELQGTNNPIGTVLKVQRVNWPRRVGEPVDVTDYGRW